jgi:CDGSH-type Zn-finger protein
MATKGNQKRIKICENGPYVVSAGIPLADQIMVPDQAGLSVTWQRGKVHATKGEYELCRCGQSKNSPFCDGTHNDILFDGTETARRTPFLSQADPVTVGPDMDLLDVPALCASARFCDRAGGAWENTRQSDNPGARKIALQEVADCPAGRLVLRDKKGNDIEPKLEPSIGLVIDTVLNTLGPLWVRGGIPIESADGHVYEIRNRVTLCRCGKSTNKPFCDGKHENK